MARLRLLFVGTINNLYKIYDDCPDSSSESAAEMAFGADSIDEEAYGGEFTKSNIEYYNRILEGDFNYCFDIRNPQRYGDYNCVNNLPFKPEDSYLSYEERETNFIYNQNLCIESIKLLPDDTVFFLAGSHW